MTRVALSIALAALLIGGPAAAQMTSPLEATSPLGLGVGTPVAPTGIPLEATELATPGVSPMPFDSSPMGTVGVLQACPVAGAAGAGTTASAIFDGGGTTSLATDACATTAAGGTVAANPAASSSSPAGMATAASLARTGIPLGSVELGGGGLSPLPGPTPMTPPLTTPAAPPALMPAPAAAAASTDPGAIVCPIPSAPPARAALSAGGC